MTVFFKGKARGQADKVLLDGKEYTDKELKEIIKKHEAEKSA